MWKWFAPLLIFAGKPEVLIRLVTLAIAAGVLAFGVWLFSNVALTFDALKNPYIEATYAIVLACFFIGVGTVTWLRVRRLTMPESQRRTLPVPDAPPLSDDVVHRRADDIAKKWSRDHRPAGASVSKRLIVNPIPNPIPVAPPAREELGPAREPRGDVRGSLVVTGPAYSGKTALISTLVRTAAKGASDSSPIVRLVDGASIDANDNQLASVLAGAAAANGVLFVIDQDLRAPEVTAIARLIDAGKPLYVVLNKADQFSAADRDAILLSIRAKMPPKFAAGHVIAVAGEPSSIEREVEDARGAVRLQLRRPSSDVQALINLLNRMFGIGPGQVLKFEAA